MMELTKPIIVGHSFGGSLAVSRSVESAFVLLTSRVRWWLPRIRASTVMLSRYATCVASRFPVLLNPFSQTGLDPWDKTVSIPLLAIGSEEFVTGDEFAKLFTIAPCVATHAIYVIRGYRHVW